MTNITDQLRNQVFNAPLDSVEDFNQYIENTKSIIEWNQVGILTDENNSNVIILLLLNAEVASSLRLCLEPSTINLCLTSLSATFIYRSIQNHLISLNDLNCLSTVSELWKEAKYQESILDKKELIELFNRFEDDRKIKGRGKDFSAKTKTTVWQDSHGRCMFTGCGEKLNNDSLSGTTGNYAYLAHNVASSENGARGITLLSGKLSDDPNNVLLLCDKHHRLIDKVASSDYSASILSKMRQDFCITADSLLDGLKYLPIPVYAVLWPVNSQRVSPPSNIQISNSLSRIKRRIHEQLNILSDNEDLLVDAPEIMWKSMPNIIESAANKILQQTKSLGYNAALFGFGPSSALIGLGAMLGNKNSITPMLRNRGESSWSWPDSNFDSDFFEIEGLEELKKGSDFVINFSLTAEPDILLSASESISKLNSAQIITIRAKPERMGNAVIANPEDGKLFSAKTQSLFHKLKSELGAERIHLFSCASNAASVFIGQAYDVHHPELIVYDFDNGTMIPRLKITNKNHSSKLQAV